MKPIWECGKTFHWYKGKSPGTAKEANVLPPFEKQVLLEGEMKGRQLVEEGHSGDDDHDMQDEEVM